jgi:hypothetical protein
VVFWDECLPEALVYFGEPVAVRSGLSSAEWTALLEQALQSAQDAPAAQVRRRDPTEFWTLLGGDARAKSDNDGRRRLRSLQATRRCRRVEATTPWRKQAPVMATRADARPTQHDGI